MAPREDDAFRASVLAWRAPELRVGTLRDDDDGTVHVGAPVRFANSGGNAAWGSGGEFQENLRTIAELGAHGVHDLLLNLTDSFDS